MKATKKDIENKDTYKIMGTVSFIDGSKAKSRKVKFDSEGFAYVLLDNTKANLYICDGLLATTPEL